MIELFDCFAHKNAEIIKKLIILDIVTINLYWLLFIITLFCMTLTCKNIPQSLIIFHKFQCLSPSMCTRFCWKGGGWRKCTKLFYPQWNFFIISPLTWSPKVASFFWLVRSFLSLNPSPLTPCLYYQQTIKFLWWYFNSFKIYLEILNLTNT